jgi:hypothetical protein
MKILLRVEKEIDLGNVSPKDIEFRHQFPGLIANARNKFLEHERDNNAFRETTTVSNFEIVNNEGKTVYLENFDIAYATEREKRIWCRNEFVITSFSHSKRMPSGAMRLYNGNVTIRYKEHDGTGRDNHEKVLSSKNRSFKVFELFHGTIKIDGKIAELCWNENDVYLGFGYCPVCRDIDAVKAAVGKGHKITVVTGKGKIIRGKKV